MALSPRCPGFAAKSLAGERAGAADGPASRWTSRRPCALRVHVEGVQRLARRHGQANAADQLSLRRPHGDAAVADRTTGVARAPQVAVDIAASAIGRALDAVDREIGEALRVGRGAV